MVRPVALLFVALALALAACHATPAAGHIPAGGRGHVVRHAAADDAAERPSFLAAIPADTPILWLALERVPVDYLQARYFSRAEAYRQLGLALDELAQDHPAAYADEGADLRLLHMLLHALGGKLSPAALASIGVDLHTRFAIFAVAGVPVLRAELADAERFARVLDRALGRASDGVVRQELGSQVYYELAEPGGALIVAVVDGDVVLARIATGLRDAALPLVLGQKLPARSLANDGTVDALVGHGADRRGLGFVDLARLGEVTAASLGADPAAACQAPLAALAAAAPRIELTTTAIDRNGLALHARVALSDGLFAALQGAAAPLAGVDRGFGEHAGLAVALGLDLGPTLGGLAAALGGHAAGTCPLTTWVDALAHDQATTVAKLASSPLASLRGGWLRVDAVDLDGASPRAARGGLWLASQTPSAIAGLLAPSLGSGLAGLAPGDAALELSVPARLAAFAPAHASVRDHGLAIWFGTADDPTAAVTAADPPAAPPLVLLRLAGHLRQSLAAPATGATISTLEQALTTSGWRDPSAAGDLALVAWLGDHALEVDYKVGFGG